MRPTRTAHYSWIGRLTAQIHKCNVFRKYETIGRDNLKKILVLVKFKSQEARETM
jgi:hypothetical protein